MTGVRPPSKDPCLGCQERQVCSAGIFLPLGDSMRPVCVHPCDELDLREWLDGVARMRAERDAMRPVVEAALLHRPQCYHTRSVFGNASCRQLRSDTPCAACNFNDAVDTYRSHEQQITVTQEGSD